MNHMRKLLLVLLVLTSTSSLQAQKFEHGPLVSFDKELYDFDTSPQGGNGECQFILTNVGDEPLIISNFQSSCGCLVGYYAKEPIMPGKTSILHARYDTNRPGPFTKSLTLTTNAVDRPVVVLRIKGVVRPKAVETVHPGEPIVPER